MHYRVLLSCMVLGAAVGACSDSSAPQGSGTGGTTAAAAGGSSVLASGGTGGSLDSTGAATGGASSGGPSGSGGRIDTGTGGISIAGTGGTNAAGTGGANAAGTGGALSTGGSTNAGGATTAGIGGSRDVGAGGNGASAGGTNASGGRISTGGTSSAGTGGNGGTGGRVGTGGVTTGGGTGGQGGTGGNADPSTLPSITVHLAGDSTMADYASTTTQEGWGQEFGQFFISKVTIDNQAQGGANVQTFYAGKWKALIANVRAGDYVLAAFGINDSGTAHGPVSVANFTAEFKTMAAEVAAKKATFLPTTSSPLQAWVDGKETNDRLQPYCDATIAVGQAKGLLVDDLNARGIEYYNLIGQTAAAALTFNGDKAHFNKAGATAMAQLAAKELKRIGSPLAAYLK